MHPREDRDQPEQALETAVVAFSRSSTKANFSPIDGHEHMELALFCANFRKVDTEIAHRIALELLTHRLVALDFGQVDVVALQAAMRDRWLQCVEAITQRRQCVPAEGTMTASSSAESTVAAPSGS
ncbi:hypothetical protein ACVJBD_007340 [Rhizobium mongolense]